MSGMEIPLLLAGGGALLGSQVDKENPLRGALLGGAAGFTGGTALAPAAATGVGSAAAASGFGAGLSTAPAAAGTFGASALGGTAAGSAIPGVIGSEAVAGGFGATLGTQAGSAAATAEMLAGTNSAVNAASNAVAGGATNPYKISLNQAMSLQRQMGGLSSQGGTQTQTGAFKPGQQVNLADPIASLLAPKRKKERPMISLL